MCWVGRFLAMLKPGGRLLISDYCKSEGPPSTEFEKCPSPPPFPPVRWRGACTEARGPLPGVLLMCSGPPPWRATQAGRPAT